MRSIVNNSVMGDYLCYCASHFLWGYIWNNHARACVRACGRACMRACVHACVCASLRVNFAEKTCNQLNTRCCVIIQSDHTDLGRTRYTITHFIFKIMRNWDHEVKLAVKWSSAQHRGEHSTLRSKRRLRRDNSVCQRITVCWIIQCRTVQIIAAPPVSTLETRPVVIQFRVN